ncbi:hypothetical protein LEP1GSC193_2769 [Leptospira alstonii serovar Pingchang str. 80-412]|uniref:Uncharacterized protein n=1 Tax=Leptospira alstonii serovar Pingchang str. 80-412 TaxID=1218564 RepID=T0FX93_9LEPT|nr:hypothetical protein LEP1GSC193_2769 [Leptospira alstonii serovar Pingchang str. 80-412]
MKKRPPEAFQFSTYLDPGFNRCFARDDSNHTNSSLITNS